jgi:hypothetical protein
MEFWNLENARASPVAGDDGRCGQAQIKAGESRLKNARPISPDQLSLSPQPTGIPVVKPLRNAVAGIYCPDGQAIIGVRLPCMSTGIGRFTTPEE